MHYLHVLHTEKESNKADGAKYKQLENLGKGYTQVSDTGLANFLQAWNHIKIKITENKKGNNQLDLPNYMLVFSHKVEYLKIIRAFNNDTAVPKLCSLGHNYNMTNASKLVIY